MTITTVCRCCKKPKPRLSAGDLCFICDDCVINRGPEAIYLLQLSALERRDGINHPMFIRVARETVIEGEG